VEGTTMKQRMIAVMVLLLLWTVASMASRVTLTDIRYAAIAGGSRVTLMFDGDMRYSQYGGDGTIHLGFSHAGIGIAAKARRQTPATGAASAITVTAVGDDSVAVTIALRTPASYRCILPASGNALFVDLLPGGDGSANAHAIRPAVEKKPPAMRNTGTRVIAAVARQQAKPAPGKSTPVAAKPAVVGASAPVHSVGVIDIPALAREQMRAGAEVRTRTSSEETTEEGGIPPAAALGIAAAAALLMIGSGVGLAFMLRKAPPRPAVQPAPPQAEQPKTTLEEELRNSRNDIIIDDVEDEAESRYAHETSLQLARTFRRGSEEITLARRLHDHTAPQLSSARMEETLNRATTPTQRLHFARKMGVGRGEMDLAAKLRTIKAAEKKEGAVA
jgi:hypothetical protein